MKAESNIKRLSFTLLLAIALFSCNGKSEKNESARTSAPYENETFTTVNPEEINQQLERNNDDLSAQDVMRLFYPNEVETGEGNETIEISEEKLQNGNTSVTLIHDNLLDDSQRGVKLIMELKREKSQWTVISIKKNWKCWSGRGNTDWGTDPCK